MPKDYIVLDRVVRSNRAHDDYLPGERVAFDDERAAVLLKAGVIAATADWREAAAELWTYQPDEEAEGE